MAAAPQIFLHSVSGTTHVLRDVHTVSDLHAAATRLHAPSSACGNDGDDHANLVLTTGVRALPLTPELADVPLADVGVVDNATVFASARLLGGGKKRKKKTYTKPKKIKHKHKTVKLAVLKYYKIGSDGEVQRLRKECPASTCGAGVFLAAHSDRAYCGRCGMTFVEQS